MRYIIGRITVLGRPITVLATDKDEELEDGRCRGYYAPGEMFIVIDSREGIDRRTATLAHELAHAALDLSGLSRELPDELEERLIEIFLPPYLASLGASTDELAGALEEAEDEAAKTLKASKRAKPRKRARSSER